MAILEVKNLKKNFGELEVLKGIDFSLEKGDVMAVIGSSGNGKTTLLRCINFLETPNEGEIIVNGETLFDASQKENATSLIYFESPSMLQYNSASLRLLPQTEISLKNRNHLDQIILANKKYKEMLQTELKIYKKYADNATLSRWGYNIADLLTTVTLLNQINFPKINYWIIFCSFRKDEFF